jgi:amino acid adenylation domain-containing protein
MELPLHQWWSEENCNQVRLPGYPFRRDVHWLEPVSSSTPVAAVKEAEQAAPIPLDEQVVALFAEVTGLELIDSDRSKQFPELGLDSLLLTQIAVALQESFDVVITIKDLVADSTSIDAVCQFVEARAPKQEADASWPGLKRKDTGAAGALSVQQSLPRRAPKRRKRGIHRRDTRPQTISGWDDLGDHRAAAVKTFIATHAEKTKGSKAHTDRFRQVHADPRTAAGFHRVWKEIAYPIVCAKSSGAELWDVDGNRYIDMLSGFGPNMLGHDQPVIKDSILKQLELGMEIGPQSVLAGETAALVCELTGMDRASFMCTGSEAVQAAIRCARTYTRRSKIVLFEDAYHGNFDEVLVRSANRKGLLKTNPGSPGIPRTSVAEVIVLPWNSPASLAVIDEIGDQLAAVMVEPVQSRTPDIQPAMFLRELREITARHETVLIFDEVVTGFRCNPGGAQAHFGIDADLATYGKVAGGNMPLGIVAGREAIMNTFDGGTWSYGDDSMPTASVTFFAGTFVRHPLAVAACNAMLRHLVELGPELQSSLAERTSKFSRSVNDLFRAYEAPFELPNFTSVMYLRNNDVSELGSLFWYALRDRGVFALEGFPSYMTAAHTDEMLDEVMQAIQESLDWMVESELLVKPRKLIIETDATYSIPLYAPEDDLRLGEDQAGNPGWYRKKGDQFVNIDTDSAATPGAFDTNLESVAPTSESQQEVWSAAQLGDDASCAFNESVSVKLEGRVDIDALRSAIRDVAMRHKSMRSSISADGSLVKVRKEPAFDIDVQNEKDPQSVIAGDVVTPFDIVNGPLFRFTLVPVSSTEHILVMTAHHIACDGWSSYLILKELGNRYRANLGLDVPELPAADDLAKYNEAAANLADTESEDYWLDEYATIPPIIDFPTDTTRPALRTFESERVDVTIPAGRLAHYKSFASDSSASLFTVLLAGWYAYVARIAGISDLVVGVPSAGQASSGMTNLVGHCVNLLPVRLSVDVHRPFPELVANVQARLTEALSYQDYTFGRLLRRLPLTRDPSRIPLVPMQFNLDPPTDPEAFDYGADIRASVATNPRAYENFELFLNIAEIDDGLDVQLQFNSTLFTAATMRRRIEEYFTLLDAGCTSDDQVISHLQLLTDDDESVLAATSSDLPELNHDAHFLELFERHVSTSPEKVAVKSGDIALTYRELDEQSGRLAAHLIDSAGGKLESNLIGVALQRRADMIVSLLATWKAGAAYVPLDPEFPPERLSYMAEDAGLTVVLTNGDVTIPGLPEDTTTINVDALELASTTPLKSTIMSTDRAAYVIYTSGSTGQPKGVEVGHRAVSNFLQSMAESPGIVPEDTLVAVTTLSFDIAVLELYAPLAVGATVVVATHDETQDGAALSRLLQNCAATLMQATPVTWRMLLEAGWQGPREFRVLCGGEAFPADLATQLAAHHDSIFNLYGPTEATVWSTIYPIHGPEWRDNPESRVPIGRPIHGTTVHVLDEQLQPLPTGVPGELYIGGVGLANCYLNRDELTQQRFIEHPRFGRLYRTGDLVTLDDSGVLRFHARVDSQVKVRGFRVELGEIESALSAHPDINEVVANVYEPGVGDARLVAYYVSDKEAIDDAELRDLAQEHLPRYMVPQHFVPISAIPLTPNRKADRKALPPPVAARDIIIAPRNETEKILVDLWKDVLRSDEVSVDDDFFSLGGHSILATRMISQLEDQISVRVPLKSLFAGAVLSDFANHVAAARLGTSSGQSNEQREVLEF